MYQLFKYDPNQVPWNKGKLVGQKLPLKLQEIWAIRIRLQLDNRFRDLALFNLAVDSKLRACDLLNLRVSDISTGGRERATYIRGLLITLISYLSKT